MTRITQRQLTPPSEPPDKRSTRNPLLWELEIDGEPTGVRSAQSGHYGINEEAALALPIVRATKCSDLFTDANGIDLLAVGQVIELSGPFEVVRLTLQRFRFPLDAAPEVRLTATVFVRASHSPAGFEVQQLVDFMYALIHGRGPFIAQRDDPSTRFELILSSMAPDRTIDSVLQEMDQFLGKVLEDSLSLITHRDTALSLIHEFNFANEVSVACEQYLLYFTQFLRDLGIEADARIERTAQTVLFSVTPTNKRDTLERIREALAIYLQVPGNPEMRATLAQNMDVAAMHLQANVAHLESQLTLAKASLQLKDATIQQKDLALLTLKDLFLRAGGGARDALMLGSSTVAEPDSEPVLGRYVELVPHTSKGVRVNPHLVLRDLRRARESSQDERRNLARRAVTPQLPPGHDAPPMKLD